MHKDIFEVQDVNKRCLFHNSDGHSTDDCLQLKDILKKLTREGNLTKFINPNFYKKHMWRYNGRARDFKRKIPYKKEYEGRQPEPDNQTNDVVEHWRPVRQPSPVINVISGGDMHVGRNQLPRRKIKQYPTVLSTEPTPEKKRPRTEEVISFSEKDQGEIIGPHDDPVVLNLKIETYLVKRALIDTGSSADILYLSAFKNMDLRHKALQKVAAPLIGFTGDTLSPKGMVQLKVAFGTLSRAVEVMVDFLVVNALSAYNAILNRGSLNRIGAIVSSPYLKIKFHTEHKIREECG